MYKHCRFSTCTAQPHRFTLIKNTRSSHVCQTTLALYSFISLTIRISDVIITSVTIRKQICNCHAQNRFGRETAKKNFRLIFGWTFLVAISASRNFFFGRFSADNNPEANPAIGYGWGVYCVDIDGLREIHPKYKNVVFRVWAKHKPTLNMSIIITVCWPIFGCRFVFFSKKRVWVSFFF